MSGKSGGSRSVVIVDDDEIYRVGAAACLRARRDIDVVGCWAPGGLADGLVLSADAGVGPVTALVEASSGGPRRDGYGGVAAVTTLRSRVPAAVSPIVVTCRVPTSRYLLLRLAEAGADFVYGPCHQFGTVSALADAIRTPCEAFRLPTQWALRQELGLAWDGDLAAFLAEIEPFPDELWTAGRRQDELPVSRRTLRAIRQLARDVAGLPPPDFRRFTGTIRPAPSLPEWQQVRALVTGLRGTEPALDARHEAFRRALDHG
jgi:hypothetical protein